MTTNNCAFDLLGDVGSTADSTSSSYNVLLMMTGIAVTTYALARFFEANNTLKYESRSTRIIAGLLMLTMRMHTKNDGLEIVNKDGEGKLIAAGPHRTGWEAIVLASKMKGTPPRFFATNVFNAIPGVSSFMSMFKVILVEAYAKGDKDRTANKRAIEKASEVLQAHGCVALFPQGGFSRLGEEPRRVYDGAAKLALINNTPIHVVRLDGYWCLQNSIIPLFVRNNTFYRAFLSAFHMNNVRATECAVINFHMQPESEELSEEQKIEEINARLYAYFRYTDELTAEQMQAIGADISEGKHLLVWRAKVEQDKLKKSLQLTETMQLDSSTSLPENSSELSSLVS